MAPAGTAVGLADHADAAPAVDLDPEGGELAQYLLDTGGYGWEDVAGGVAAAVGAGFRYLDLNQTRGTLGEVADGVASSGIDPVELVCSLRLSWDNVEPVRVPGAVEDALEAMGGVDAFEVLSIDWPADHYDLGETLKAMQAVVADGLARSVGVSNLDLARLSGALDLLPIAWHRLEITPFCAAPRHVDLASDCAVTMVAHSSLAHPATADDPVLTDIAEQTGTTVEAVVLAWLLARGIVPSTAPRDDRAIRDHIEAARLTLTPEQIAAIASLDRGERVAIGDGQVIWDDY